MAWVERVAYALVQTALLAPLLWLGYLWVTDHEKVCRKCRERREMEQLKADVAELKGESSR